MRDYLLPVPNVIRDEDEDEDGKIMGNNGNVRVLRAMIRMRSVAAALRPVESGGAPNL